MTEWNPKSSCCLVEAIPLMAEDKGKEIGLVLKCVNCGEFCEDSKRTSQRKVLEKFTEDLWEIDQSRDYTSNKTERIKKRIEEALDLL